MIDVLIRQSEKITSPLSTMPIFTLGGAVSRVPERATAFPNRNAQHNVNIVGAWTIDDPDPDRHIAWVRETWEAIRPYSTGVYVNFMSDEPADRLRSVYGPEKYERLANDLALHAQTEEELLYPAAILVGDIVRARLRST